MVMVQKGGRKEIWASFLKMFHELCFTGNYQNYNNN